MTSQELLDAITPTSFSNAVEQLMNGVCNNLPNSNHREDQEMAARFFMAKCLETLAAKELKPAKATYAQVYGDKLTEPGTHVLEMPAPFVVTCKVSAGRQTFDKDAFIKEVSQKYNLSARELQKLAATTTKTSAPAKSFSVEVMK